MATTSSARTPWDRAATQQRIRHPLHSLRGYIRWYVLLEGAAIALLYVALCFWAALILDYGQFELLWVDWIKATDQGISESSCLLIRGFLLAAFVIGLLGVAAFMILRR